MKNLVQMFLLTILFFLGHFSPAAQALESDLILPKNGVSKITLKMREAQPGIDTSTIFQVFVGTREECCENKSPIAGRYTIDGSTVTFVPAFDFIEGLAYTVEVFDEDANAKGVQYLEQFIVERTVDIVSPSIVAMFPSGTHIPENTLRFYIHFSTPMKPHVSSDFIKLVDANGVHDAAAFMAFKQELWSEDRKRLTLLMDPGRIKRGVAQNLTLGPALQEGGTYSIVIEKGWPTANGTAMMPRFENPFVVSSALRTLPDTSLWTITLPKNMTNDPLIIDFDRPFDSALLMSTISVMDEDGQPISGDISVESHERSWRFDRNGIWNDSQIQIAVDTQLEDVAGNNFIDLLDHAVGAEASTLKQKLISLALEPSPK